MSSTNTIIWINDPTILLNKDHVFDLWPVKAMCFEAKLNAITRLIILLTILGFILTGSTKILLVGVITIAVILVLYQNKKNKIIAQVMPVSEGFKSGNGGVTIGDDSQLAAPTGGEKIINPENLDTFLKSEFKIGTKKNPFSNVLLTDIMDEPNRKAAPPSFNVDVDEDITKNTKRMVQYLNPGIKNTNKQLFSSLTDNFYLDNSLRVWNATPNTKVANDQGAFMNFLYGDMYSSKEDNAEGALMRLKDNVRYTLY